MSEHNTTFGGLAAQFLGATARLKVTTHAALDHVAERIEVTAKEEIGTYQPAVGGFPAWAPLADSTKGDRVAQGFPADEPLLRTGDLRDSISHDVHGHEAAIGSTSDVMVWQEMGTATIPPRPVLGPAAVHEVPAMLETLGAAVVAGVRGTEVLPGAYNRVLNGATDNV